MKRTESKSNMVCGDCVHYFACSAWNVGSLLNASANACINFQKDDKIHAHWIFTEEEQYCSHCTAMIDPDDNSDSYRFDYCPWCGAKMDEEVEA